MPPKAALTGTGGLTAKVGGGTATSATTGGGTKTSTTGASGRRGSLVPKGALMKEVATKDATGDEKKKAVKKKPPPNAKPMGKKYKEGYWTGTSKLFKPHGVGTFTYDTGDIYIGMYASGLRQTDKAGPNKFAKYTFKNGAFYRGEFSKGRMNGTGRMKFPDGTERNLVYKDDIAIVKDLEFKDGTCYNGKIWRWMRSKEGKISFPNGDTYEGCFKQDRFMGEGTYSCHSGDVYVGNFENGWCGPRGERGEVGPGEGRVTFAAGDVYIGKFDSGLPHGEGQMRFVDGESVTSVFDKGYWEGTRQYSNGDVYTGKFYMNEPSGHGVLKFRGGASYEGQFLDGQFSFEKVGGGVIERGTFARGKLTGKGYRLLGQEQYQGDFKEGFYHGDGVLEMLDTGMKYEGQFMSGRFHGEGRLNYGSVPEPPPGKRRITVYPCSAMRNCGLQPEGAVYEGRWLDGQRNGKGYFECEQEMYEGEFLDDLCDGRGEWVCLVDTTPWGDQSRYVGEWVKGKRHGQGEFTSAHGYTYKGGWKDGMKAGTGVESTLPPGNSGTYVGDFLRDLKHGNGVMRYDSGGVYQGDWKAGVRQGQGRELFVSGAKYEGSYYNDMLNGEGFYEAPPVGRDERVKVYKRRLLMEAEKLLVQVDIDLDNGRPDLAEGHLKQSTAMYEEAGFLTPPRPLSAKALRDKMNSGYVSSVTDVVARATAKEKREVELAAVRVRIDEAHEAVKASEDMDPVLKKLREEQEIKARMEFLRREHAAEDEVKRKEAEMRAEAGKMADEAMEKERKKLLKEMEKEWKKKGGKGRQPQLPKERPERVAKIKKEETAKAMEVLKKRERERIDAMIKEEGEKKKAEYEEQVRELSNGNYRGNFMDNKRHGFGVRTYGNGDVYEGLWKDGKREGKGKIVFKNGTVYEGPFHEGQYHGKGTLVSDISKYEGSFVNGKMEGKGVQVMSDGSTYEGDYWDGKPHGAGKRIFRSGAVYEGEFRWGACDGEGRYLYDDGSTYVGFFKADLRHGYGTWEHLSGDRFQGEWRNDVALNGKGVRIDRLTGSLYAGDISHGTYEGYGFFRDSVTGENYEGKWKRGKRHGWGISQGHPDTGGAGSRFEGEWEGGRPSKGFGKMIYPGGGWYVGDILRGTRDGVGVMAYPNGEVYDGRWRSNMKHGHGCMVRMRSVYSGEWHFDEVGAEVPVWEPFEDDSYVDHAVNRDALLHIARALGCDKGKARVVHDLMSAHSLRILTRGAMSGLRDEWAKLRKEEDRLLIITMGPRHTHPASLREDLHRVRKTGAGLVKKARELIAERAWEVLPERAKAKVELKTQVKMAVADLVSRLSFKMLPSAITWASPPWGRSAYTVHAGNTRLVTRVKGPPVESRLARGKHAVGEGEEGDDGEPDVEVPVLKPRFFGGGLAPVKETPLGVAGDAVEEGGGDGEGTVEVKTHWTLESAEQPIVLGLFGETHKYGTVAFGAKSGEGDAPVGEEGRTTRSLAERRRRRVTLNQQGNTALPSVVSWTLHGIHPRRKYLPSVATWYNHEATPVRRILPTGYWRVIHSASTPLGRTPEPKKLDVFLEVAARISSLVSRQILSSNDQRMFEVLGCLPGVDPMQWIKTRKEDRPSAWRRWKDVHDAWQLQTSPSMATWASGVRILPPGLFGGRGAEKLAGLEEWGGKAAGAAVAVEDVDEEELRKEDEMVDLYMSETLYGTANDLK